MLKAPRLRGGFMYRSGTDRLYRVQRTVSTPYKLHTDPRRVPHKSDCCLTKSERSQKNYTGNDNEVKR